MDKAAWDEVERRVAFLADMLAMRADEDMVVEAAKLASRAIKTYRAMHSKRFIVEMSKKKSI